jgi:hypothetical protein
MRLAGLIVGLVGSLVGTGVVAGAAYYGWEIYTTSAIDHRIGRFKRAVENLDADVKFEVREPFGPEFTIENVVIISDDKEIRAERIELKRFDWQNPDQPRFSEFVVRGVKFKGDIFGSEIGDILAEAKFEHITFDFFFNHEYREEVIDDPRARGGKRKQGRVLIKDARMEIKGLGTLLASFDLEDWHAKPRTTARLVREFPPIIRIIGERVKLKSAELAYQDSGFMNAYIDAKASATGKSWLTARGDIVRDMQRAAREGRTNVANQLYTVLIRYVERNETITGMELSIKPEQPMELRKMHAMWEANPKAFYENSNVVAKLGPAKKREPRPDESKREERREDKPKPKPDARRQQR